MEEPKALHPNLEKMIKQGIPVSKAEFNAAVNNADNVPENYFSEDSNNSSRRAQMWLVPAGLLCMQKGKYFLVPPTFKYAHLKHEVE